MPLHSSTRPQQIVLDDSQVQVEDALRQLSATLAQAPTRRQPGLVGRLLGRRKSITPIRGLYIWGTVGRGKTMLMDRFYEQLPVPYKMRSHFHRFMHDIHGELKRLNNLENPLEEVAERLAMQARVICFDEFFVNDIADAMILGTLFEALFRRGVTLVATSNVALDQLYRDGLQRQRFLPAIALLQTHTRVVELGAGVDYRLRVLEQAEIYHCPLDSQAEENLERYFQDIAPERDEQDVSLVLNDREVTARRLAGDAVWFDFHAICGGPRSQDDYIELARCYQTVMVSGIPQLTRETEDEARRFISLVDEFYDRNVKLIVSADVSLDEIYRGRKLEFEFRRTRSRMQEMQSQEFLARPHLP
ncbi:MAG: cell division protein ZapE [Gammaproteobacteria bacterium]|nr:cell division protein ZapE [Gammaproteobacteria bacterium]